MSSFKMFREFAVDPAAVCCWKEYQVVMHQMGSEHGRLLSKYPKKWERQFRKLCEGCSSNTEMQISRMIEHLEALKRSMIRSGRPWEPSLDWINNVLRVHTEKPFDCIISSSQVAGCLSVEDITPEEPSWKVLRDRPIDKDVASIVAVAAQLLTHSKDIQLIDPYLSPFKSSWKQVLRELLPLAFGEGAGAKQIELHARADRKEKSSLNEIREDWQKHIGPLLPAAMQATVYRWDYELGGKRPHPRYILTDVGGLRFDYGFDPESGLDTDVSIIDWPLVEQRRGDYSTQTSPFVLVDRFIIRGPQSGPEGERP